MLADVRSRDQDFGERDRVIGEEVELEVVLGVWVRVDLSGNVDDQADSLTHYWNEYSILRMIRRFVTNFAM